MKLSSGCCDNNIELTPTPITNRPGQTSLKYRVGTHAAFFETMIMRLSCSSYPELAGLTTRDPGDFSIALLDAWAIVADVLTFYQERIANEGYLRTATERFSILELAQLVGYTLRPGVASSVYLAYELEKGYKEKVEIPAGARAQSLPTPGELPQSFETSELLSAQTEWNALKPRMTRPQNITLGNNTVNVQKIYLKGTATNLKLNDKILLDFGDNKVLMTVIKINNYPSDNRTEISIQSSDNKTEVLLDESMDSSSTTGNTENIVDLIEKLSILPNLQPPGSQFLNRDVKEILNNKRSDFVTQALVSLNPRLSETFYPALSSVNLVPEPALKGIYVLQLRATLFGYNALVPTVPSPHASFKIDPDPDQGAISAEQEVSFIDQSTGTPISWSWDFGDGHNSNLQNPPPYSYSNAGIYTISLIVENAGGTSTASWTITVLPPPPK